MINYKIVHELDNKRWSEFVLNHVNGNIFQTPEMYKVYLDTKKYEPLFLAVIDQNDNILGILLAVIQKEHTGLLGIFSARSIIFGGPLVKDNDLNVLSFILKEYNKIIKGKAIYSQFRNMWNFSNEEKKVFNKNGIVYEEHLDIIHDLDKTDEEFFTQMHKGRRKNVRRAINKEVIFEEIVLKDELIDSLIFIKETYKRIKLPLPDDSLFVATFDVMFSRGLVHFFKVSHKGSTIGVRFVFSFNDLVYDWFAGTDENHLDKYPNDFLPFKVMQWGRNSDYKTFQFGGAGKPNKPYGVRDYKLKFGGKLVNWGRFEKTHKPNLMKLGKLGLKILQRIR